MRQWVVFMAVAISASQTVCAQSEAALWEALEGRTVLAKVDLPATKSGVNIDPDASAAANEAQYGKQLRQFGTSTRRREPATITDVKVNPKSIAIELERSDSGTESPLQVYVAAAKSPRETSLERQLEHETDPERREKIEKDLEEMRAQRAREDARLRAALSPLARGQQNSNRSRADSGTRFNLVFPSGVPSRALRPDYVMAALKPWIDFESLPEPVSPDAANRPGLLPPQQTRSDDASSSQELRKGMTESDLKRLLGEPLKREPYLEGDLHVEILTFKRNDAMVEATMVEGVLVKFKEWSE